MLQQADLLRAQRSLYEHFYATFSWYRNALDNLLLKFRLIKKGCLRSIWLNQDCLSSIACGAAQKSGCLSTIACGAGQFIFCFKNLIDSKIPKFFKFNLIVWKMFKFNRLRRSAKIRMFKYNRLRRSVIYFLFQKSDWFKNSKIL